MKIINKCRICKTTIACCKEEHHSGTITNSEEGNCYNNTWFCNQCLKEMHIPELFKELLRG